MVMPGKRLEKCSTCTRDCSLCCSSAASWVIRWGSSMASLVEQRMQRAVLAVVHLPRALVDLQRDADQRLVEPGRDMGLHHVQQRVAGALLHRLAAARAHADVQ